MLRFTSFAEAAECNAKRWQAAKETRKRLENSAGGLRAFLNALEIVPLRAEGRDSPFDQKLLGEYLQVLASGILADELVPRENFLHALSLNNQDASLSRALGPHKYLALAVMAPGTGMIGAMGVQVYCHLHGPATLHGSYYAVLPSYRGCGVGFLMIRTAADQAVDFIAAARREALGTRNIFQFIETNDIAKMTLADRLEDEAIAMHPLERDRLWEAFCFREIQDIGYRQRAEPPRPLSLKVQSIDIVERDGRYRADGFRAVNRVPAPTVLRHVSAFDNLLMNFDEAEAAARESVPVADLQDAGLINRIDASAALRTVTLSEARGYRRKWMDRDRRIRERIAPNDWALAQTMKELAWRVEGGIGD